jgi:phenylacetic acid degradation operon negative regulatory protein
MNKPASKRLDRFLLERMQDGNFSSTTLVFTFFCDVVTQHGGVIWIGSIIHALAPLGINARLTRTAVFRLVRDGWLESRKHGRRSYYQLTKTGRNYYQRAAKRIYASRKPEWDGVWTLLFISLVPEDKRDALHRGLSWLGYGRMAAGVYGLPSNDRHSLDELLSDLGLKDNIVQMQAQADNADSLQKLILSRWKLSDLRHRYKEFTTQYRKAGQTLELKKQASEHSLLLLRVLLMHEYRRILLRDPELPSAMLPSDWEGFTAQLLAGRLYRELAGPTSKWVNRELLNADGDLKGGSAILKKRFPLSATADVANLSAKQ